SIVKNPDKVRTVGDQGGTLRVAARVVPTGPSSSITVVSGLSTNEVDRTLHRLVVLEFVIGVSAIVVALLATSWGVQFSLRRLRSVTTTAQDVAAELSPSGAGLDRRGEVDEPDTEVGQLATSMNTLLAA